MAWVAVIGAGASIAGGLIGSKKGATNTTQTQTRTMDPRIDKMYFGTDGSGGLLGDATKWYEANKTGMNQDMRDGIAQQNAVWRSPMVQKGYEGMANTGYELMNRKVSGNPFEDGRMQLTPFQMNSYQQPQVNHPAFQQNGPQQGGQFSDATNGDGIVPDAFRPQQPGLLDAQLVTNNAPPALNNAPPALNNAFPAATPAPVVQAPAPVAESAAKAAPTQEEFQRMYAEEMKRQQLEWQNSPSSNYGAGYGA